MKTLMLPLLLIAGLLGSAASAQHGHGHEHEHEHGADPRSQPWPREVVDLAKSLPLQDGGRIKPLDTYAQFTLLRLNGKRTLETPQGERIGPTEWLLDVLLYPDGAADYESFLIQNAEVVQAIGVSAEGKRKRDRYSYNELAGGVARLFQLAKEYQAIEEKHRSSVQQQVFDLAGNVSSFLQLRGFMEFARHDFEVGHPQELSDVFGGMERASFSQVVAHLGPTLELYRELLEESQASGSQSEDLRAVTTLLQHASEVAGRAEALAMVAPTGSVEKEASWLTPSDLLYQASLHGVTAPAHVEVIASLEALARNHVRPEVFQGDLARLHTQVRSLAEARGEYGKIAMEVGYYKAKLLAYSQYIFVLAFLLMAFMWLRPRNRTLYLATSLGVLVPTLMLSAAIVVRCMIRGRPPVSTLYETVLFVTATGVLVALFIELVNRQKVALSGAAILGTIGLFIANGYEMLDKRDTMPSLVAVLDTNFWLATHVTSITIGYSAGMLAALLASVYLLAKAVRWRRTDRDFYRNMGRDGLRRAVLRALMFSLVGHDPWCGIWANDSWGRFWGWDPKENGALMIVVSRRSSILHARMGGYLREYGICMATAFSGTDRSRSRGGA